MKRFEAIGNTSDINRYNMMFAPGALWSGYEQTWEHGLPAHLGHDLHALVGWNDPLALYFTAKRTAFIIEILSPETDDEQNALRQMGQAAWEGRLQKQVAPHLAELKERLGTAFADGLRMEHPSCAALAGPELALRRFPELFEVDDDGLVPLAALKAIAPGVFEKDGLLLFAHPYFRRSLSRMNTLNGPFLQAFQETAMPDCVRKIRLDTDMVGLPETFQNTIELAYWRGPIFKDDLASIPKGVTQYKASETDRRINGISLTEFRWNELGDRSFECEELRDSETLGAGEGLFGCRYVHTMLNAAGKPDHADGAIRMYDEGAMLTRLGKDLARAGKKTVYTKLWRVDGELSVPLWKELVAHYYRDNPLVGEYLGGDHDPVLISEASEKAEARVCSSLPPVMSEAQGVHVTAFLKRAKGDQAVDATTKLIAWDRVQCGTQEHAYYEADSIEVAKVLTGAGAKVILPANAARVDWRDGIFNFPSALHEGPKPEIMVARTLAACLDMFVRFRAKGSDIAVTVTVGVRLGDVELWTSCAGRLGPIIRWLEHPASKLPGELSAMMEWSNKAQTALRELFPGVEAAPGIDEIAALIRRSGALRFRRMFVGPGEWHQEKTEKGTRIVARPPRGEEETIVKGEYRPTAAIEIVRSTCALCGKDYIACPHTTADGGENVIVGKVFCIAWGRPSTARTETIND